MADSRTEQSARRLAAWFDPEMVVYGLFGIFIVYLGARALAIWVVSAWANGQRLFPSVALSLVVAGAGGLLVLLRHRKRFLYLGLGLVAVGFVAFLLASLGFTLPPSWVQ